MGRSHHLGMTIRLAGGFIFQCALGAAVGGALIPGQALAQCAWSDLDYEADCTEAAQLEDFNFQLASSAVGQDNVLRLSDDAMGLFSFPLTPIDARTGNDTLILTSGINGAGESLSVDAVSSFENLVKEGDASWTVSGTDTSFTTITVSAGTLDAALVLSDNAVEVLNTSIVTGQIDLGGGSNVITNALNWRAQVTAGDGDDRAINSGVIHDVLGVAPDWSLGGGNDTFTNDGILSAGLTLDLGAGEDQFQLLAGSQTQATIDFGAGNDGDAFTIDPGATFEGFADLGDGNNTINIRGAHASAAKTQTGSGVDALRLEVGARLDGEFTLGGGADVLTIDGTIEPTAKLFSGAGSDSLTLASTALVSLGALVDMGEGGDSATLAGQVFSEITMGAGADAGFLDLSAMTLSAPFLGGESGGLPADDNRELDTLTLSGSGGTLTDLNLTGGLLDQWEQIELTGGGDWTLDNGGVEDDDTMLFSVTDSRFEIPTSDVLKAAALVAENATLEVDGTLNAPATLVDTDLLGRGEIVGDVSMDGGVLSPGAPSAVGALTIDGDLTLTSDTTLLIHINNSAGRADLLTVSGTLNANDAVLEIDGVTSAQQDYTFQVINADEIEGDFTIPSSAALVYTLDIVDPSGEATLRVFPNYDEAGGDVAAGNAEETRLAVAAAIETGALSGLMLDALDDVAFADYLAVMDGLHGEVYTVEALTALRSVELMTQQGLHRLGDRERCGAQGGLSEVNCRRAQSRKTDLWVDVMVDQYEYDVPDASLTGAVTLNQALIGLDSHNEFATFGFTGAYTMTDATMSNSTKSSGQHAGLSVFGSRDLGLINLDGSAAYGVGVQSLTREVEIEGTLKAEDSFEETIKGEGIRQTVSARAAATQEFQIDSGVEIQPRLGLSAVYVLGHTTTETSADGGACVTCLRVDEAGLTRLLAEVGGEARLSLLPFQNIRVFPEIRANWQYSLLDNSTAQTNALVSEPDNTWETVGYLPPQTLSVGAGVNVEILRDWVLYGDYDLTRRSAGRDDLFRLGLRYSF